MKLMLGSGKQRGEENCVRVDVVDFGDNVVHDLSVYPWLFEDNTFDEIEATDILEHMIDAVGFINEMIRVGKPDCAFRVQVPSAEFPEAVWDDPEHVRGFGMRVFDFWQRGTNLQQRYGASKNKGRFFIKDLMVSKLNYNLVFEFRKDAEP